MVKKLSEFVVSEKGVVQSVSGEGAIRRRLFDMGLTPGAEVFLRKTAPFGDPLEITIRGYELTLRKAEAAHGQHIGARKDLRRIPRLQRFHQKRVAHKCTPPTHVANDPYQE